MPLNPADRTSPAPPAFVPALRSKGQRGFSPIRFLGSLRGEGSLAAARARVPVTYQIDLYESASGRTGSGALEGPLGSKAAAGDLRRLRLDDGSEVEITLQETDAEGAVFETRGAIVQPPAGRRKARAAA